ncbi:TPA: taurine catabolism dioxygenase TauD, partial [Enterobacter cloacae]
MITQLEFNDLQKDELSKLISRVTISPYTDYKLFKQSITELIENGLVPTFFVQACERVRQERKDQGINAHLLKNVPLDTIIPEFDQSNPVNDKYAKKLTFVGEALLELFAQLTDSPLLAYRTRNNGDFFHDVYADKKYSNTQTQKTDGELYYHNDRTAHPVRADFLSLLGMRCSEENLIFTGYLDGKAILDNLKAESQEWLRKPLFITPFDEYSRDSNASQIDSELHPILENIH